MKLILDTHVLIWYMDQDHLLTRTSHAAISDPDNDLYISAATIWELSIKVGIGNTQSLWSLSTLADSSYHDLGLRCATHHY